MARVTHHFKEQREAEAFTAGVEYVNDSTCEVVETRPEGDHWVTIVEDEDSDDDHEIDHRWKGETCASPDRS